MVGGMPARFMERLDIRDREDPEPSEGRASLYEAVVS